MDGPREWAREVGVDGLPDGDLIALILGTGARGTSARALANELLQDLGGVGALEAVGPGELAKRRGVGEARALRLLAGVALGRRLAASTFAPRAAFPDAAAVHRWAASRLVPLPHEELWLLALDGRQQLLAARRVAQGGLARITVEIRDVLRIALREGAHGFLLSHNHPSGDATPSAEDVLFTRRVAAAARNVDVPLLDHVVVAANGYISLLAEGVLER
jgi:DNA repair protein RadC